MRRLYFILRTFGVYFCKDSTPIFARLKVSYIIIDFQPLTNRYLEFVLWN